jgi:hypothetical protein
LTAVPEFTRDSKVREVLALDGERGRQLLFRHGFDVGEGFEDVLSQWQTLEQAHRGGRLRGLEQLLAELNSVSDRRR